LLAAEALGRQIEPEPEVLKCLPLFIATGDDRAQDGGEGVL